MECIELNWLCKCSSRVWSAAQVESGLLEASQAGL